MTSFSARATLGAQLFSPRRHPWNSHHAELQLRKLRCCLHVETSACCCTTTGQYESLSKKCNSGTSTVFLRCWTRAHVWHNSGHVNLLVQEVWTGTSTSFLNCLEHERLSLHTMGITNLSKNSTWGISTESAQFALCVPAVLSARTAGASRCKKQRRQPPSKNCNSGNSTVFCTVWTNHTCQAQQRA